MIKECDFTCEKRGPVVKTAKGRAQVTIRLDDAVLDYFASGPKTPVAAITRRPLTMSFGTTFSVGASRSSPRSDASYGRSCDAQVESESHCARSTALAASYDSSSTSTTCFTG